MSTTSIDLEAIATEWAKDYFKRKATSRKEKKILSQDRLGIKVDWKRVQFVHSEPRYVPEPPKVGAGKPTNNCLFHTTYTNKTDDTQTYNFKAERTTRSTCSVDLEQCYTEGYEVGITLKTPCEILEANAGFHRELSITKATGNVTEEELCWGVDSEVKVPGKHKAMAKMIINEEEYEGKFELKTTLKGSVHIVFTNMKDNNSFMRAVDVDIFVLLEWARDNRILPQARQDMVTFQKPSREIIIETKGSCLFKYGLKQDVEVDHIKI